jgi:F-type H+-transporting ATPase subunit gamma
MGRGQLMKLKEKSQSIKSIKHITKAMEMVARAKFQKVEKETLAFRPYSQGIRNLIYDLTKRNSSTKHPLLTGKDGKTGLLVISSDMGLCGSYNSNLVKILKNIENPENLVLYVVGKIGFDRLKNHYNVQKSYIKVYDRPNYEDAQKIAKDIIKDFNDGVFGKFAGIYTYFRSVISYEAKHVQIIPTQIEKDKENNEKFKTEYEYHPSPEVLLDNLFEDYISAHIFNMLLEAKASELGARQTAMKNATDNADELIYELTLSANKARQSYITQELTEIVSGVEALNKG